MMNNLKNNEIFCKKFIKNIMNLIIFHYEFFLRVFDFVKKNMMEEKNVILGIY